MQFCSGLCLIALCLLLTPSASWSQKSAEESRRQRVDDAADLRRTESISGGAIRIGRAPTRTSGWLFDHGATISTLYAASDNNDRQDSVADAEDHSWTHQARIYAIVQDVPRKHTFYARIAADYTETKKNSPAIRGNDFVGPKIDMLYWEHARPWREFKHRLKLGRQFVLIGRGLAFGLTADGVRWEARRGRWTQNFVALRQKPGDDNIDFLAPGAGRTKRLFYGYELGYRINPQNRMGAYILLNDDRNFGFTVNAQKHQFDSRYYGFVFEAAPARRVSIWGEFVLEKGRTYPHLGTTNRIPIHAHAFDLGFQFLFGGNLAPTLYAEFAGASGDRDRLGNVFSSSGGSSDGRDSAFRGFGGLSFGVALAPTFSNLHAFKIGGSVKPFGRSRHRMLQDMTVQTAIFHYLSEDEAGPTSDPVLSGAPDGLGDNVGREFDAQVAWKPLGDIRYFLQYGLFMPGTAYGVNRDNEQTWRLKLSFDL